MALRKDINMLPRQRIDRRLAKEMKSLSGGMEFTNTADERAMFFEYTDDLPAIQTYDSPAFGFVLPPTRIAIGSRLIDYAWNNGYMDYQTKMVMVDMTLYNAQIDFIIVIRFMFAMTKAGGVIPSYEIHLVRTTPITFLQLNVLYAGQTFSGLVNSEILFYVYFFCKLIYDMITHRCRDRQIRANFESTPVWV